MTRRLLFLLAAGIVLIYFSIIALMLSPLHGPRGSFYGNNYMNHFGFRVIPSVTWCRELRWMEQPSTRVAALVSYPGSGNTWLRYLLQQVTGILTGSVYMDYGLRAHGFPAENVTDGRVLVVKTHKKPESDQFHSAILLIRNPRDAILADFNRKHQGHVGIAPKEAFDKMTSNRKTTEWQDYVSKELNAWEDLNKAWLTTFDGLIHVVDYDTLVDNTEETLEGVLGFLNVNVTKEHMDCAIRHKEGIYRRKKKHKNFDPYTRSMYIDIENVRSRVLKLVQNHNKPSYSNKLLNNNNVYDREQSLNYADSRNR